MNDAFPKYNLELWNTDRHTRVCVYIYIYIYIYMYVWYVYVCEGGWGTVNCDFFETTVQRIGKNNNLENQSSKL